MSPLALTIILHYSYSTEQFRDMTAPAIVEVHKAFVADELLSYTKEFNEAAHYTITLRGRAYVQALCNIPLPVKVTAYVMPSNMSLPVFIP